MIINSEIFFLPIYSKSPKKYCKDANKEYARKTKDWIKLAKLDRPLSHDEEIWFRMRHYAPPWKVNDIIGFFCIGYDLGTCITGEIFLKLKKIPKGHYIKQYIPPNSGTVTKNNQIFHYVEIPKVMMPGSHDLKNNNSIVNAIREMIRRGELALKEVNRNWRFYEIPFSLDYIDFTKIFEQFNEREK